MDNSSSNIIDIAKFVGISLVVFGHLPGGYYAYYFHMPFFFFISGITLSYSQPMKKGLAVVIKTYKYIFISYVVIGLASLAIKNIFGGNYGEPFGNGIIETINLAFRSNFHNNSLFLVCWFLVCYAFAYILSSVILYCSERLGKHFALVSSLIAILIGFIGVSIFSVTYTETKSQLFNLLCQVFYASMFMILGKNYGLFIINKITTNYIILIIATLASIVLTKISLPIGMSWSKYPSGFASSSLCALLSIILCLWFCKKAHYISVSRFIKYHNIMTNIGKSSKHIMAYHLLVFVMIDLIAYSVGVWDISKTSALNHFGGYVFLPMYVFLGVIIPYLASSYANKIPNLFKK